MILADDTSLYTVTTGNSEIMIKKYENNSWSNVTVIQDYSLAQMYYALLNDTFYFLVSNTTTTLIASLNFTSTEFKIVAPVNKITNCVFC
jgi:hypothetical protein